MVGEVREGFDGAQSNWSTKMAKTTAVYKEMIKIDISNLFIMIIVGVIILLLMNDLQRGTASMEMRVGTSDVH